MSKRGILFLSLVLLFTACAPTYIPNLANIPLLEEEKELNICAAASTAGSDVQIAYAINNDIAIMANGTFTSVEDGSEYHKHLFGEIGFGKFWAGDNSFKAEIFGGFGAGNIRTDYDGTNPFYPAYINAGLKRIFIQPNLGFRTGFIDLGMANRLSLVHIDHEDNALNSGKFETFWEPGIVGKLGYKIIKGYAEFGLSIPVFEHTSHYNHLPVYFGIGLQLNIKPF